LTHVPGLVTAKIETMEDLEETVKFGSMKRSTESHKLNNISSRSHAILTLIVTITTNTKMKNGNVKQVVKTARLNLVDLAGSERVKKTEACGERLKEANAINKSLGALGDVITALASSSKSGHAHTGSTGGIGNGHGGGSKASKNASSSSAASSSSSSCGGGDGHHAHHIPFRNSKLTYLLQNSLCGKSKVLMICTIAPAKCHVGETICSLNFAKRCRSTQLNNNNHNQAMRSSPASIANHTLEQTRIKQLEQRVKELENELVDKENDMSTTASTTTFANVYSVNNHSAAKLLQSPTSSNRAPKEISSPMNPLSPRQNQTSW
jgi:kinesin family member C2/C3